MINMFYELAIFSLFTVSVYALACILVIIFLRKIKTGWAEGYESTQIKLDEIKGSMSIAEALPSKSIKMKKIK